MLKKLRYWLLILCLLFPGAVWGNTGLDETKSLIKKALINSYYTGEYSITTFRFGRRQEVTYRIYADRTGMVREVISPVWQRGDLIMETNNSSYYYIYSQNCGLKKQDPVATKNKFRMLDMKTWIEKIAKPEGTAQFFGNEAVIFSGENAKESFKLWVNKSDYFPLQLEIYRNQLLDKAIRFHQYKPFMQRIDWSKYLSITDNWIEDETKFWQMVSIPRVQQGVNFQILKPAYLPEGYLFKKANLEELPFATVVHLVYEGPGHQILSIFERESLANQPKINLNSLKKLFADKSYQVSGYQCIIKQVDLTLVGSLSDEELKKIANSIN